MAVENVKKMRLSLLGEVSVEVKSTTDSGEQREPVNNLVLGVVGDLESTSNGLQKRHGHVCELGVGDEGEGFADRGEVGSAEIRELVAVETQRAVDGDEGGSGEGGDVAQSHVVGPDEVGKGDGHIAAVGLDGQRRGDVAELHGDIVEVRVVGEVDGVDDLEVDSVKRAEEGVLDVELSCCLDTCAGEGKTLKSRKSLPNDGANIREHGEAQGGQNGKTVQVELVRDGGETAGGERGELCDVVSVQASLNLL